MVPAVCAIESSSTSLHRSIDSTCIAHVHQHIVHTHTHNIYLYINIYIYIYIYIYVYIYIYTYIYLYNAGPRQLPTCVQTHA